MSYYLRGDVVCALFFFFFNDTATTEIYTLSLHDALPILHGGCAVRPDIVQGTDRPRHVRSEEHTSELQSQSNLVCRLLLEKKKNKTQMQQPRSQRECHSKHEHKRHTRITVGYKHIDRRNA